jgi:hypothetical protein
MSWMRNGEFLKGENPDFLAKLDTEQQRSALTFSGKFFLDQFVHISGEHCYIVGPTGSGKTNKGYSIVNWLMHRETIIWISSGKDNEILPLLFLGKPVRIITPKYHDVQIMKGKERYEPHPEVIQISNPEYAWLSVRKGHINIFEFRNAFWEKDKLLEWMIRLFTVLATWTRLDMMPYISPAAIFIDESRWVIAGSRISNEGMRTKASEIITENAMEIRSYGYRLVIFAQDFTDVPPAMRDNMPCFILCSGAEIETNRKLRYHCNPTVPGWKRTIQYKRNEAKFVDRFGNAEPQSKPVPWPLFPKKEEDRELCRRMKVKDVGFHDRPPEETEIEEECFPELGRFSASAIPPEKQEVPEFSRFGAGMIDND